MARVFDVPRYENQALFKMLTQLKILTESSGRAFPQIYSRLEPTIQGIGDLEDDIFTTGFYEQYDYDALERVEFQDPDEEELFRKYCYSQGLSSSSRGNLDSMESFAKVLEEILMQSGSKPIYGDCSAMTRIVSGYLIGKYIATSDRGMSEVRCWSSRVAVDICSVAVTACRLGSDALNVMTNDVRYPSSPGKGWAEMLNWCYAFEGLKTRSYTQAIRKAHRDIGDGCNFVTHEDLSLKGHRISTLLGTVNVSRILGLYILEYTDNVYVLDYSALDQVFLVSKFWEGTYRYATNYRLSGNLGECNPDMVGLIDQGRRWVAESLEKSTYSQLLPRSMKQSLALMQNEMHSDMEILKVGHEKKTAEIESLIESILPLEEYWHQFLAKLDCPYRVKLDVAHLFYGLTSPDANINCLIKKGTKSMRDTKRVDQYFFSEFMNYCQAVDFVTVTAHTKKEPKCRTSEGYDFRSTRWFKACLRGIPTLPPDAEFGLVCLDGHFHVDTSIDAWYWEASDVTHINADRECYEDLFAYNRIDRCDHNELLYALAKAPLLSNSYVPCEVLRDVGTGKDDWARIAAMAAKNENTKPYEKIRETWSGDDCTRELMSAYDKCAIPLAAIVSGVTSRKPDAHVKKIFSRICKRTAPGADALCLILSNDVSGWSPSADRDAWAIHHDYVVSTTDAPPNLRLLKILGSIEGAICKRGVLARYDLPSGLFQGWTGTLDSLLNVRISLFCVRIAKRSGHLRSDESAITAGLIDDAVQAVELSNETSTETKQLFCNKHSEVSSDVWSKLGAALDMSKTLMSSIKFIYLNRFFCQGSEVLTPMRVFSRADKEYKRRFAGIHSQIDTVLGSYCAAVDRGSCPMASYAHAIQRCLELLALTNKSIMSAPADEVVNMVFAPRFLGGCGMPHIVAWLTQESQDPLTMYTGTICSAIGSISSHELRQKFSDNLFSTLNQPPKQVSDSSLLRAPRSCTADGVINPDAFIASIIKRGMHAKCKSEVFKQLLELSTQTKLNLENTFANVTADATVLELLGQTSPNACLDTLVDRAYKNELVTQLFPFSIQSKLLTQLRSNNKAAVGHVLNLTRYTAPRIYGTDDATELAISCRENFYTVNGVFITNHTVPDYATTLMHSPDQNMYTLRVTIGSVSAACPGEGKGYLNLYDGICSRGIAAPATSKSAFSFSGEEYKMLNPIAKCIAKAAIVSKHVSALGGDGDLIWRITNAMWGVPKPIMQPKTTLFISTSASLKRLSTSTSHRSHPIACFPNTQNTVEVETSRLGRHLDNISSVTDFLSFLTVARTIGILNLATYKGDAKDIVLGYNLARGSMIPYDKTTFKAYSYSDAVSDVSSYADSVPRAISDLFLKTLCGFELSFISSEDAPNLTMEPYDEILHSEHVEPGEISGDISGGARPKTSLKFRRTKHSSNTDQSLLDSSGGAKRRYEQISRSCDESSAVIVYMAELVHQQTRQELFEQIVGERYTRFSTVVPKILPKYAEIWINVCSAGRKFSRALNVDICHEFFAGVKTEYVRNVSRLKNSAFIGCEVIVGYLYCASWGRYPTPTLYNKLATVGMDQMSRAWKTAKIRREWRDHSSSVISETYGVMSSAAIALHRGSISKYEFLYTLRGRMYTDQISFHEFVNTSDSLVGLIHNVYEDIILTEGLSDDTRMVMKNLLDDFAAYLTYEKESVLPLDQAFVSVEAPEPSIGLPTLEGIFDLQFDQDEPEAMEPIENNDAFMIYLSEGEGRATAYLRGEFNPTDIPIIAYQQDELDDFHEFMLEYDRVTISGQHTDG